MYRLFIVAVALIFTSCKKTNEFEGYSQWDVVSVGADKAMTQLHGTKIFSVEWPYTNGCQIVNKFNEEENGNIITVKTYGKENSGFCTQDAGNKTTEWKYTFHRAGNFEFRFLKKDGTFFTIAVPIR